MAAQTQQVLSPLALEPHLAVGQHHRIRLPPLDVQHEPALGHLLPELVLTLQDLLIDGVQAEQSVLEGVLFPLEAHLPQHCYRIFGSSLLLPPGRGPFLLKSKLNSQLILERVDPAHEVGHCLSDEVNLIEDEVVQTDGLV
jgi:hypothetical protein